MDPPTLINHGSYNLAEIWPFALNGGGGGGGGGSVGESNGGGSLELRMAAQFGQSLGQFADSVSVNRNLSSSVDHPMMVLSQIERSNGGSGGGARKRRDSTSDDESIKVASTSGINGNSVNDNNSDGKRIKKLGSQDKNHEAKTEVEASSGKLAEEKSQPSEPPKQDYIHVRARRGQATDSHSLAERARREKISERMKILQDLVPGCNKVIGKALVLDEIINYIQSLQRQVEFLSMKLEAVNSRMNPEIEGYPSKDQVEWMFQYGQQTFETAGVTYGSQAATEYGRGSSPEWLHMQVGGGFERT